LSISLALVRLISREPGPAVRGPSEPELGNNKPKGENMQKITPFLWFDDKAEEAMNFYVSIFKNSKIVNVSRYGDAGPGPKGTVMVGTFQLDGQEFMALNGGPHFKFTEAISLFVNCETQEEVDYFWEKLSEGGEKSRCGWLKDKYGLSWQVVPTILGELMRDKDAEKSKRVMEAMLRMDKIDIKTLKQAYEGQ
jgi:predicted 3-demethylubiquinone-9 3-methyltransferase (glyoxalase superfamily)